jgi:hypothetical protein
MTEGGFVRYGGTIGGCDRVMTGGHCAPRQMPLGRTSPSQSPLIALPPPLATTAMMYRGASLHLPNPIVAIATLIAWRVNTSGRTGGGQCSTTLEKLDAGIRVSRRAVKSFKILGFRLSDPEAVARRTKGVGSAGVPCLAGRGHCTIMSSVKKEERLKKSIGARVAVDGVGEGTLRCVVCGVMQLFVLCVCAMHKTRGWSCSLAPTRTAAQTPTHAHRSARSTAVTYQ